MGHNVKMYFVNGSNIEAVQFKVWHGFPNLTEKSHALSMHPAFLCTELITDLLKKTQSSVCSVSGHS